MGSVSESVTMVTEYSTGEMLSTNDEVTMVTTCINCSYSSLPDLDANAIIADDILYIIYILIGSLAFPANVLVVVVILCYPSMRKLQTNMYIVNQSLIDSTVALCLIFTTVFQDNGKPLVSGRAGDEIC